MLEPYGAEINLAVDNAHTRVVRLVGSNRRVLELGCGVGHITRVLIEHGCTVTAIELNAEAAGRARETGARIIVADLDTFDWSGVLGEERFDVIVAGDVLEHVRNPRGLLSRARPHLTDGGVVVASIPNVAHVSVITELLQGRFSYQPTGLLDDTHIHFFTRNTIYECFEGAGLEIATLERITARPEETEFRTDFSAFSPDIALFLTTREEADTYQFVLTASPARHPASELEPDASGGVRSSAAPLPPQRVPVAGEAGAVGVDGFLQAIAARWMFVEDERNHHTSLIGRLREQLLKAETHIGWLTAQLQRTTAELEEAKATHERQLAESRHVEAALNRRLLDERFRMASELEVLRKECDALPPQVEALRRALDVVERSSSWRLTAPLRSTAHAIRRLRRRGAS